MAKNRHTLQYPNFERKTTHTKREREKEQQQQRKKHAEIIIIKYLDDDINWEPNVSANKNPSNFVLDAYRAIVHLGNLCNCEARVCNAFRCICRTHFIFTNWLALFLTLYFCSCHLFWSLGFFRFFVCISRCGACIRICLWHVMCTYRICPTRCTYSWNCLNVLAAQRK